MIVNLASVIFTIWLTFFTCLASTRINARPDDDDALHKFESQFQDVVQSYNNPHIVHRRDQSISSSNQALPRTSNQNYKDLMLNKTQATLAGPMNVSHYPQLPAVSTWPRDKRNSDVCLDCDEDTSLKAQNVQDLNWPSTTLSELCLTLFGKKPASNSTLKPAVPRSPMSRAGRYSWKRRNFEGVDKMALHDALMLTSPAKKTGLYYKIIENRFRRAGLETSVQNSKDGVKNVIGVLPGSLKKEVLVIGGKWTLRIGCNGMEDNGSGLTVMLKLVDELTRNREKPEATIIFVAYSNFKYHRLFRGSEIFIKDYLVPKYTQKGYQVLGAYTVDRVLETGGTSLPMTLYNLLKYSSDMLKLVEKDRVKNNVLVLISRHEKDQTLTETFLDNFYRLPKPKKSEAFELRIVDEQADLEDDLHTHGLFFFQSDHFSFWYNNISSTHIYDSGSVQEAPKKYIEGNCKVNDFVLDRLKQLTDALYLSIIDLARVKTKEEYQSSQAERRTYEFGSHPLTTNATVMTQDIFSTPMKTVSFTSEGPFHSLSSSTSSIYMPSTAFLRQNVTTTTASNASIKIPSSVSTTTAISVSSTTSSNVSATTASSLSTTAARNASTIFKTTASIISTPYALPTLPKPIPAEIRILAPISPTTLRRPPTTSRILAPFTTTTTALPKTFSSTRGAWSPRFTMTSDVPRILVPTRRPLFPPTRQHFTIPSWQRPPSSARPRFPFPVRHRTFLPFKVPSSAPVRFPTISTLNLPITSPAIRFSPVRKLHITPTAKFHTTSSTRLPATSQAPKSSVYTSRLPTRQPVMSSFRFPITPPVARFHFFPTGFQPASPTRSPTIFPHRLSNTPSAISVITTPTAEVIKTTKQRYTFTPSRRPVMPSFRFPIRPPPVFFNTTPSKVQIMSSKRFEVITPFRLPTTPPARRYHMTPIRPEIIIPINLPVVFPHRHSITPPARRPTTTSTEELVKSTKQRGTFAPITFHTIIPAILRTIALTTLRTSPPTTPHTNAPTTLRTTVPTVVHTITPTTPRTIAPTILSTIAPAKRLTTALTSPGIIVPTTFTTTALTTLRTTAPTSLRITTPTALRTTVPTALLIIAPTTLRTTTSTTLRTTSITPRITLPTTLHTIASTIIRTTAPTTLVNTVPSTLRTTVPATPRTTAQTILSRTTATTLSSTNTNVINITIPSRRGHISFLNIRPLTSQLTTSFPTTRRTFQTTYFNITSTAIPTTLLTNKPTKLSKAKTRNTIPTILGTTLPTTIPTTRRNTIPTTQFTTLTTTLGITIPSSLTTTIPTTRQTTIPTTLQTTIPTTLRSAASSTFQTRIPTKFPTSISSTLPTPITATLSNTIPTTLQTTIPTTILTTTHTTPNTTEHNTLSPTTLPTTLRTAISTTLPTSIPATLTTTTTPAALTTTLRTGIPITLHTITPTKFGHRITANLLLNIPTNHSAITQATNNVLIPCNLFGIVIPFTCTNTLSIGLYNTFPILLISTIPSSPETTTGTLTNRLTMAVAPTLGTAIPTPLRTASQATYITTTSTAAPTTHPTSLSTTVPTTIPATLRTITALHKITAIPLLTSTRTTLPTIIPTTLRTSLPITVHPTTLTTIVPATLPTSIPTIFTTKIPITLRTTKPNTFSTIIIPTTLPTGTPTTLPYIVSTTLPTMFVTTLPTTLRDTIPTTHSTSLRTTKPTVFSTILPTTLPKSTRIKLHTIVSTTLPNIVRTTQPSTRSTTLRTTKPTSTTPSTSVSNTLPNIGRTTQPTRLSTTLRTTKPTATTPLTSVSTTLPNIVRTTQPTATTPLTSVSTTLPNIVRTTQPTRLPTTLQTTKPTATTPLTSVSTTLPNIVQTTQPTATTPLTSVSTTLPNIVRTTQPTRLSTTLRTTNPTATTPLTTVSTTLSNIVRTTQPTRLSTTLRTTKPTATTPLTSVSTTLSNIVRTTQPTATTPLTSVSTTLPNIARTTQPTRLSTTLRTTKPAVTTPRSTVFTTLPTIVPTALPTIVYTTLLTRIPATVRTTNHTTIPTAPQISISTPIRITAATTLHPSTIRSGPTIRTTTCKSLPKLFGSLLGIVVPPTCPTNITTAPNYTRPTLTIPMPTTQLTSTANITKVIKPPTTAAIDNRRTILSEGPSKQPSSSETATSSRIAVTRSARPQTVSAVSSVPTQTPTAWKKLYNATVSESVKAKSSSVITTTNSVTLIKTASTARTNVEHNSTASFESSTNVTSRATFSTTSGSNARTTNPTKSDTRRMDAAVPVSPSSPTTFIPGIRPTKASEGTLLSVSPTTVETRLRTLTTSIPRPTVTTLSELFQNKTATNGILAITNLTKSQLLVGPTTARTMAYTTGKRLKISQETSTQIFNSSLNTVLLKETTNISPSSTSVLISSPTSVPLSVVISDQTVGHTTNFKPKLSMSNAPLTTLRARAETNSTTVPPTIPRTISKSTSRPGRLKDSRAGVSWKRPVTDVLKTFHSKLIRNGSESIQSVFPVTVSNNIPSTKERTTIKTNVTSLTLTSADFLHPPISNASSSGTSTANNVSVTKTAPTDSKSSLFNVLKDEKFAVPPLTLKTILTVAPKQAVLTITKKQVTSSTGGTVPTKNRLFAASRSEENTLKRSFTRMTDEVPKLQMSTMSLISARMFRFSSGVVSIPTINGRKSNFGMSVSHRGDGHASATELSQTADSNAGAELADRSSSASITSGENAIPKATETTVPVEYPNRFDAGKNTDILNKIMNASSQVTTTSNGAPLQDRTLKVTSIIQNDLSAEETRTQLFVTTRAVPTSIKIDIPTTIRRDLPLLSTRAIPATVVPVKTKKFTTNVFPSVSPTGTPTAVATSVTKNDSTVVSKTISKSNTVPAILSSTAANITRNTKNNMKTIPTVSSKHTAHSTTGKTDAGRPDSTKKKFVTVTESMEHATATGKVALPRITDNIPKMEIWPLSSTTVRTSQLSTTPGVVTISVIDSVINRTSNIGITAVPTEKGTLASSTNKTPTSTAKAVSDVNISDALIKTANTTSYESRTHKATSAIVPMVFPIGFGAGKTKNASSNTSTTSNVEVATEFTTNLNNDLSTNKTEAHPSATRTVPTENTSVTLPTIRKNLPFTSAKTISTSITRVASVTSTKLIPTAFPRTFATGLPAAKNVTKHDSAVISKTVPQETKSPVTNTIPEKLSTISLGPKIITTMVTNNSFLTERTSNTVSTTTSSTKGTRTLSTIINTTPTSNVSLDVNNDSYLQARNVTKTNSTFGSNQTTAASNIINDTDYRGVHLKSTIQGLLFSQTITTSSAFVKLTPYVVMRQNATVMIFKPSAVLNATTHQVPTSYTRDTIVTTNKSDTDSRPIMVPIATMNLPFFKSSKDERLIQESEHSPTKFEAKFTTKNATNATFISRHTDSTDLGFAVSPKGTSEAGLVEETTPTLSILFPTTQQVSNLTSSSVSPIKHTGHKGRLQSKITYTLNLTKSDRNVPLKYLSTTAQTQRLSNFESVSTNGEPSKVPTRGPLNILLAGNPSKIPKGTRVSSDISRPGTTTKRFNKPLEDSSDISSPSTATIKYTKQMKNSLGINRSSTTTKRYTKLMEVSPDINSPSTVTKRYTKQMEDYLSPDRANSSRWTSSISRNAKDSLEASTNKPRLSTSRKSFTTKAKQITRVSSTPKSTMDSATTTPVTTTTSVTTTTHITTTTPITTTTILPPGIRLVVNVNSMYDLFKSLRPYKNRYRGDSSSSEENDFHHVAVDMFKSIRLQNFIQRETYEENLDGMDVARRRDVINVIGMLPGKRFRTEDDRILVIGANYDTVQETPGVDFDGSGVILLVEIAKALVESKLKFFNTIYFVQFDAGASDNAGSRMFVNRHLITSVLDEYGSEMLGAFILNGVMNYNSSNGSQIVDKTWKKNNGDVLEEMARGGYKGDFIGVVYRKGADDVLARAFADSWESVVADKKKVKLLDAGFNHRFGVKHKGQEEFSEGDHAVFWKLYNQRAVSLTDTGRLRGRMRDCFRKSCDDFTFVSPRNLEFMKQVGDSLLRTIAILAKVVPASSNNTNTVSP